MVVDEVGVVDAAGIDVVVSVELKRLFIGNAWI